MIILPSLLDKDEIPAPINNAKTPRCDIVTPILDSFKGSVISLKLGQ